MEFNYDIQERSGIQIISLTGKLIDKDVADELLATVEDKVESGHALFVLDLKDLGYINSTGINVLINVLTKSRNAGGETVVVNVPERINKLLVITKLTTVFNVADSVEAGIAELEQAAEESDQ